MNVIKNKDRQGVTPKTRGKMQPGLTLLLCILTCSMNSAVAADSNQKGKVSPSSPNHEVAMNQDALYNALLDALYATFGRHPGFRVAHAKGILIKGTFTATPEAQKVSRAAHLQGKTVPVLMRFSNFSGLPGTRDGDPMASPHGLAIRFFITDTQYTDIVAHSFDGFPVATPEEFLVFLQGIASSVATPTNPQPLDNFLSTHPRAKAFLDTLKPAPASYAGIEYFGVNALSFSNARNESVMGRYRIEPLKKGSLLDDAQAQAMPDNYLRDELTRRLKKGPVKMRLMLQLATKGDAVDDGSIPWSRNNPEIELGVFTLNSVVSQSKQACAQQRADFNPGRLTDGIAPGSDPMIEARQKIYEKALQRRQQIQ